MQLSVNQGQSCVFSEAVSLAFVAWLPPLPCGPTYFLALTARSPGFPWRASCCLVSLLLALQDPRTPVCLWLPCCAAYQGSCTVKGLLQLICIGICHVCFVPAQTNQPCITLKVTGGLSFPPVSCRTGKMIVSCQGTSLCHSMSLL